MRGKAWLWLGVWLVSLCACTANQGGVWREPFDEVGAWRLSSDAAAEVTLLEGQLVIEVFEPGQIAWASTAYIYTDFTLAVDATQVAGPDDNEYGVLVRMDEDASFYAFSVSGDGYARAALYADSTWTVLGADWFVTDAVQQGAALNRLTVDVQGPVYTFRVNDQEVLRVEHAGRQKGNVGLYAGAAFSEAGVIVAFDNLEVHPLP